MKRIKQALALLALAMTINTVSASAQIYVNVRPARPHYVRVAAPSPRHIWVDEEWTSRGGHYEWAGGHWVERPYEGAVWVPGHWRRRPHGWVWIGGHWRR